MAEKGRGSKPAAPPQVGDTVQWLNQYARPLAAWVVGVRPDGLLDLEVHELERQMVRVTVQLAVAEGTAPGRWRRRHG